MARLIQTKQERQKGQKPQINQLSKVQEQVYTDIFEKLDEIKQFLEKYNISILTWQ